MMQIPFCLHHTCCNLYFAVCELCGYLYYIYTNAGTHSSQLHIVLLTGWLATQPTMLCAKGKVSILMKIRGKEWAYREVVTGKE